MGMAIARNDDRFPARPVRHATKPTMGVFVRDIIRLDNIESLLQIHARTESLIPSSREHSASQLRFRIVPLPQGAELDSSFDREAVAELRSVYGDEEDVLAREADEAVLDVRVRVLNPRRNGILCAWS